MIFSYLYTETTNVTRRVNEMVDKHSKTNEIDGNVKKRALTNKNIIQTLRLEMNFTEEMAKNVMEVVSKTIYESLLDDRPVRLNPIGTMTPYVHKRKNTFNPLTGEPIDVEPRRRIKFRMSDTLKQGLNPDVEAYKRKNKKK